MEMGREVIENGGGGVGGLARDDSRPFWTFVLTQK